MKTKKITDPCVLSCRTWSFSRSNGTSDRVPPFNVTQWRRKWLPINVP